MKRFNSLCRSFADDQRGVTMIEYGFIASLVSIGIIASMTLIGEQVRTFFITLAGGFKS